MITDRRLFVGRKAELRRLTNWVGGVQPHSVNVHGPRRMGKSSLIHHFVETCAERMSASESEYVAVYLTLQGDLVKATERFYRGVARALANALGMDYRQVLRASMLEVADFEGFERALQLWKEQNARPVVTLDEFEAILELPLLFPDDFFNNLRSLTNTGLLVLILATKEPLRVFGKEFKRNSAFFNDGLHLSVGKFTEAETHEFVTRPALGEEAEPCLTAEEQKKVLEWAGRHPYALSLAARLIFEHRNDGGIEAAWRQFNEELDLNPSLGRWWRWTHLPVQGIPAALWRHLCTIGDWLLQLANFFTNLMKPITALTVIIIILLLSTGMISFGDLHEWIQRKFVK